MQLIDFQNNAFNEQLEKYFYRFGERLEIVGEHL